AILGQQLRADLDSKLLQQLTHYQQMVSFAVDESALATATADYLSGAQSSALRQNAYVLSLQTADGTVVSNSSDLRLEELAATQTLLRTGEPYLLDVDLGGRSYRVAGTPVRLGDSQIGAVEIGGSLAGVKDTLQRLLLLLAIGGALGCLVVGLGTWVLMGRALDPVRRITRTAASISHDDLTRRIGYSGPRDEIGELALTMDAMLDRLQSAFTTQEQFISDASHELRTPLTIIKGHLQVLDRQESPDPAFVRQEHGLVIEELDRMNRLVADLLTLARATRVDFLRKESIDLDGFLQSLVAQGPHLGERTWVLDSLPGGSVLADQDRLTQVFLNLIQNAVQHTLEGQVVAVGGERTPDRVLLWVRDQGAGMSPDTVEHVFERFYRGAKPEGAGAQDADTADTGAGLGLAIVKAIVEAHGGNISVDSRLGAGTRFTVSLRGSTPGVDI
ncbi:MAG: HAMP domain-containing histidine kinase, partial [Thermoleophilia bacterium]|nr:HAMP domain-containing histidine kinase [Thermoleophilia bacterium]